MFCSNCGKKLNDDAKFCDACGTKVSKNDESDQKEESEFLSVSEMKKCPYCSAQLQYDAITCPACGQEIRGRGVGNSVKEFFQAINQEMDEEKKISLIKTFPIPNERESIKEFMFLAISNFDAQYYATNMKKDSIASAWYTKIGQCYQKGISLLTDPKDLLEIETEYHIVKSRVSMVIKIRIGMIALGVVFAVTGLILLMSLGKFSSSLDKEPSGVDKESLWLNILYFSLIAIGVVLLIFGFKRKRTNKEIELARQEKIRKEEYRLKEKELKIKEKESK